MCQVQVSEILVIKGLDLWIMRLFNEHVRAECRACEILKAERLLNARLRKLIGMLYLKLGRVWWYKWSCASSKVIVATMNL